jgi:hypothetical protein
VTAIRRRLPLRTARQLVGEAGPPASWQGAAVFLGAIVAVVVGTIPGAGFAVPALTWLAAAFIPAAVDTDGWRIRLGMAWLSAEQRRRGSGQLPRSPAAAEQWLVEHPDASARSRSTVLFTAGRPAEARAALESVDAVTDEDRASVARMLAAIDGLRSGTVETGESLAAIDRLQPAERTYHLLALAWSIAWVDRVNGRPWRRAFAAASRGIGTSGIPRRWLLAIAAYELILPICVAVVILVWAVIVASR